MQKHISINQSIIAELLAIRKRTMFKRENIIFLRGQENAHCSRQGVLYHLNPENKSSTGPKKKIEKVFHHRGMVNQQKRKRKRLDSMQELVERLRLARWDLTPHQRPGWWQNDSTEKLASATFHANWLVLSPHPPLLNSTSTQSKRLGFVGPPPKVKDVVFLCF